MGRFVPMFDFNITLRFFPKKREKGVNACRGAPTVSNFLFADDSLILMQADARNVNFL